MAGKQTSSRARVSDAKGNVNKQAGFSAGFTAGLRAGAELGRETAKAVKGTVKKVVKSIKGKPTKSSKRRRKGSK